VPNTDDPDQKPLADPRATVMFSAEDVEKLKREAEAVEEAAREEDPLIGTLIREKWRVLKRLGAGSFGTVYKVEDVKGGWTEALKILGVDRLAGAEADETRARFLREAQIMKRLGGESQHIVGLSTYEEDLEAGLIYFLMEFVEGRSLADALREQGPFEVDRTVRLALQVCDALMAAHEGPDPVVHRDLKLENLMLTQDRSGQEMVKVLDFGIAKIAEREADSRLTTVGTLGTPGYAAPEQLRAEAVDGRTDLFAFGVILYALLTGRDPWLGNLAHEPTHQIYELMVATDRAEVRPIDETGRVISPTMVNVVMKLLRRDPAQRFQSARELRDALQRIAAGSTLDEAMPEGRLSGAAPSGEPRAAPDRGTGAAPNRGGGAALERSRPASAGLAAPAAAAVTADAARRRTTKRFGNARLASAFVLLAAGGATAWAQPWGRTLTEDALMAEARRGSIPAAWLVDGGFEGGLRIVPLQAASDLQMPFFARVPEGDLSAVATRLREAGVDVDVSWEVARLTELAVQAQTRNRYFGLEGGDVRSYALRLAELVPASPEAASLLLKVGERMAWDAAAAMADGVPERASDLVEECLRLVAGHPRCLEVSQTL